MDSRVWYTMLVGLVVLERGVELWISRRSQKSLEARGGYEVGSGHYPWMVLLHATLPMACVAEVWIAPRVFHPVLGISMAFVVALAMSLRYWVISSLGERWTTRVVVLPGAPLVRTGPYRWLRHPNYLAVALEVAALPMIHSAWITATLFSTANALILKERLAVENTALGEVGAKREST